jgi:hypothetical protein
MTCSCNIYLSTSQRFLFSFAMFSYHVFTLPQLETSPAVVVDAGRIQYLEILSCMLCVRSHDMFVQYLPVDLSTVLVHFRHVFISVSTSTVHEVFKPPRLETDWTSCGRWSISLCTPES